MTNQSEDVNAFELHGFLEIESLGLQSQIDARFSNLLNSFRKINSFAWSLQYEFSLPNPQDSIRETLSLVLYSRILNFSQSAYLLAIRGMRVPSETQLRCSLEPLFLLGALTNDGDFLVEYNLYETKEKIKKIRAFRSYLERQSDVEESQLKELKDIEHELFTKFIKKLRIHSAEAFASHSDGEAFKKFNLSVSHIAQKACLVDFYELLYRASSSSVHSDFQSLESGHLEIGGDFDVRYLKNEPDINELDEFINTLNCIVVKALEFLLKALDENKYECQLEQLKNDLYLIGEN